MLKLTLAIFVAWLLAVILFQFSPSFRQKLGAWSFYLCGLLPTWRMFGPQPVDGDFLLYYRTAAPSHPATPEPQAPFTPWQLFDLDKKPHPLQGLFFNPRGNLTKALREICQEAAKANSPNNVYYQLLLHELIRQLKRTRPQPTQKPTLLQFQIRWQTPINITPIFSSHVHPY